MRCDGQPSLCCEQRSVEGILSVERDVAFLPKSNEITLVLADALPPTSAVAAAFGLVFNGDRLLLAHLRDATRAWDLPGGHLEPGERPEAAMEREVYEETAIYVEQPRLFAYQRLRILAPKPAGYAFPYPDSAMVFYRAVIRRIDPFVPTAEVRARAFLPPEQVRQTRWAQRTPALYEAARADAASSPSRLDHHLGAEARW